MNNGEHVLSGGCRCGAIRYEATSAPVSVSHCHCDSCRRSTGAPAVTFVMLRRADFRFLAAEPKFHESSPGVHRGFCPECGTPLSWHGDAQRHADVIELYVGTFDEPATLVPEFHIYYGERVAWYDTADHLPRYGELTSNAEPVSSAPKFLDGDAHQ